MSTEKVECPTLYFSDHVPLASYIDNRITDVRKQRTVTAIEDDLCILYLIVRAFRFGMSIL
jgi:hypothetical protein